MINSSTLLCSLRGGRLRAHDVRVERGEQSHLCDLLPCLALRQQRVDVNLLLLDELRFSCDLRGKIGGPAGAGGRRGCGHFIRC